MAKSTLKLQARELRKKGESIKAIAKSLCVSQSSVSLWVRDITLSTFYLEKLKQNARSGAEKGRIKSLQQKIEVKKRRTEEYSSNGKNDLKNINIRELLIAGIALYWGEGGKTNNRIEFCNSDPKMIKFFLSWLENCFRVKKEDIYCYIGINELHKEREAALKMYWSKITGISLYQFGPTSFKKVTNRKIYKNNNSHFGTLTIRIKKSSDLFYKVEGLIQGLFINIPKQIL